MILESFHKVEIFCILLIRMFCGLLSKSEYFFAFLSLYHSVLSSVPLISDYHVR